MKWDVIALYFLFQYVSYICIFRLNYYLLTLKGEHVFIYCKGRFESSLAVKGDFKDL